MRKNIRKCVSIVAFCMFVIESVTGCGTRTGTKDTETVIATREEKKVWDVSTSFSKGINQFSYKIFEKMDKKENFVISPYSMAIAIGMLDNGADGGTKQEIEELLGIKDLEEWNASAKYYMSLYEKEQTKLLTANSVWISNQFQLTEQAENTFFGPLQTYYGVEQKVMELATDQAREEINQWILDKTQGNIDSFLVENLQENIEMLLVNAVYFNGNWELEFDENNTVTNDFYGNTNTTQASYMQQFDKEYRYVEQNGIRGIELPYEGGNIVMDIFIPQKEEENISDLFGVLQLEEKEKLLQTLSEAEPETIGTVAIPKFQQEYGVEDISEVLKELGMKQAFLPGGFPRIGDSVCVDSVLHKAKIEVDETGTTAAAATVIKMKRNAVCLEDKAKFVVNQPFLYVIRDAKKDIILFMGIAQDVSSFSRDADHVE